MGNKVIKFGKYYSFQYKNDKSHSMRYNIIMALHEKDQLLQKQIDEHKVDSIDSSIIYLNMIDKGAITICLVYMYANNLYKKEIHDTLSTIITEILTKYDNFTYDNANSITKLKNYIDQLEREQNIKMLTLLYASNFLLDDTVAIVGEYLIVNNV